MGRLDKKYKKEGFKVPDGYFDQSNLYGSKSASKEGYKVPDGYFDILPIRMKSLVDGLDKEPKKSNKFITALSWTSIAAALLALLWIQWPAARSNGQDLAKVSHEEIQGYINDGYLELNDQDVLDMINPDDLSTLDLVDHELSDEQLIDYLANEKSSYYWLD